MFYVNVQFNVAKYLIEFISDINNLCANKHKIQIRASSYLSL